MEDHVVDPVVAVHEGGLFALGHVSRQPFDQPVHRGDPGGGSRLILLRPARHLPPDVIAGPAIVGEACRRGIDPVQLYISIAALGYFYQSNRFTLSAFLGQPAPYREDVLPAGVPVLSVEVQTLP